MKAYVTPSAASRMRPTTRDPATIDMDGVLAATEIEDLPWIARGQGTCARQQRCRRREGWVSFSGDLITIQHGFATATTIEYSEAGTR